MRGASKELGDPFYATTVGATQPGRFGAFAFLLFVRKGLSRCAVRRRIHFIPQIDYLRTPWTATLPMDFVGRFENLEQDFKADDIRAFGYDF